MVSVVRWGCLVCGYTGSCVREITMSRRTIGLLVVLTLGVLLTPLATAAPPAGKMWRMGYLVAGSGGIHEAFRQGLRDLGYLED